MRKKPMEIFCEMQKINTKEEAILYLRDLPKLDDDWPEEATVKESKR